MSFSSLCQHLSNGGRESLCTMPPLVHVLFSTKLDICLVALGIYGFLMKSFHGILAVFFPHFLSLQRAPCPECDCAAKNHNVIFATTPPPKKARHKQRNGLFFMFFSFPVEMSKTKLPLCLQLFHQTPINRTLLPRRNNFHCIFFHLLK